MRAGHLSFEEFENGIMKLTSHEFTQGRNLPKYKMGGGISMGMDPATAQKQNRSATNTEIDEYVQVCVHSSARPLLPSSESVVLDGDRCSPHPLSCLLPTAFDCLALTLP